MMWSPNLKGRELLVRLRRLSTNANGEVESRGLDSDSKFYAMDTSVASLSASMDDLNPDREVTTPDLSLPTSTAPSPATSEKSGRSSRASQVAGTPTTRSTRSRDSSSSEATVAKQKVVAGKLLEGIATPDAKGPHSNGGSSCSGSRSNTPDTGSTASASKRKRDSSAGSNSSQTSACKRKKNKSDVADGTQQILHPQNDNYCWECHREGEFLICCEMCPRVYHLRCADLEVAPPQDWACHHCHAIMIADNLENRSRAMQLISVDQLGQMLKFALNRARKTPSMDTFSKPVDVSQFPTYPEVVLHPVDFSLLESNIDSAMYGSTQAFVADVAWIVHNSVIFNGANSKVTSLARTALKIVKQEMSEIETCPDCYMNAHTLPETWFTEACRLAHPLVWARLKGFPYWPAKAVKWENNSVDVRFFGRHDRAWVSAKDCYLLSEKMPVPPKSRNKTLEACMAEVATHIMRLRARFGSFVYAPHKLPFNPSDPQQVTVLLPRYRGPPLALIHHTIADKLSDFDDETSSITSTDSAGSPPAPACPEGSLQQPPCKTNKRGKKSSIDPAVKKLTVTEKVDNNSNSVTAVVLSEPLPASDLCIVGGGSDSDVAGDEVNKNLHAKDESSKVDADESDQPDEANILSEKLIASVDANVPSVDLSKLSVLNVRSEVLNEPVDRSVLSESLSEVVEAEVQNDSEVVDFSESLAEPEKLNSFADRVSVNLIKTCAKSFDEDDIDEETERRLLEENIEEEEERQRLEELAELERKQREWQSVEPEDELGSNVAGEEEDLDESVLYEEEDKATLKAGEAVKNTGRNDLEHPIENCFDPADKSKSYSTEECNDVCVNINYLEQSLLEFDRQQEAEHAKESVATVHSPLTAAPRSTVIAHSPCSVATSSALPSSDASKITEPMEFSFDSSNDHNPEQTCNKSFEQDEFSTYSEHEKTLSKLTLLGGISISQAGPKSVVASGESRPSVNSNPKMSITSSLEGAKTCPSGADNSGDGGGGGGGSGGQTNSGQGGGGGAGGGRGERQGINGARNGVGENNGDGDDERENNEHKLSKSGNCVDDEDEEEDDEQDLNDLDFESLSSLGSALTIKKFDGTSVSLKGASVSLSKENGGGLSGNLAASLSLSSLGSSISISCSSGQLSSSARLSSPSEGDQSSREKALSNGTNVDESQSMDDDNEPEDETPRFNMAESLGLSSSSITFSRSGSEPGSRPSGTSSSEKKVEELATKSALPNSLSESLAVSTQSALLGLSSSCSVSLSVGGSKLLPSSVSVSISGVKRKASELSEDEEEDDELEDGAPRKKRVVKSEEIEDDGEVNTPSPPASDTPDLQRQLEMQTAALEKQLGSSVSFTLKSSLSETHKKGDKPDDGDKTNTSLTEQSMMSSVLKNIDVSRIPSSKAEEPSSHSNKNSVTNNSASSGEKPNGQTSSSRRSSTSSLSGIPKLSRDVSISSVSSSSKLSPSKDRDDSHSPESQNSVPATLCSSLSSLGASISISKSSGPVTTSRSSSISNSSSDNTNIMASVSSSVSVIRNLETERRSSSSSSTKDSPSHEESNDSSTSKLLETSMKVSKELPSLMQVSKDIDIKPVLDERGAVVSTGGSTSSSKTKTISSCSKSDSASKESTSNLPAGIDTSKLNSSVSIIAVGSSSSTMTEKARATSTTAPPSRPGSSTSACSSSASPSTSASPAVGAITVKGQSLLQEPGGSTVVPPPPPLSQANQSSSPSLPRPPPPFSGGAGVRSGVSSGMRTVNPNLFLAAGHRMSCPPLRQPGMPTSSGHGSLPPEAGPLSQQLHQHSHKLAELMRASLEEVLSGLVMSGTPEARLAALQLELERANWRHQQELAEVRHNADIMLSEIRASLEAEKHRAVEEVRRNMDQQQVELRRQMERRLNEKITEVKRQCDVEKARAIEETKKKQWCAHCGKEALFFCCWNTSYCDYPCQQAHWPQHMSVCGQNSDSSNSSSSSSTAADASLSGNGCSLADGLSGDVTGGSGAAGGINGDISGGGHGSRGTTPLHGIMSQNPSPGSMFSTTGVAGGAGDIGASSACSVGSLGSGMGQQHPLVGMGPMAMRGMTNNINAMGGGLAAGMGSVMGGPAMAAMAAMAAGGGSAGSQHGSSKMMAAPNRYLPPGMLPQQMYGSLEHRSLFMMMGGGAGGTGPGVRGGPHGHHPAGAGMMRPPMHFRPRFL